MLGDLTINVSLSAGVLLVALWLTARHEADLDWSKLMIVSAVTGVLTLLPPLFLWSSLVEHFQWDVMKFWPLILLATLAWQIGIFVIMLNRYVWVPVPKALLAWFVVQALLIAKDSVFTLLRGGSIIDSAWTTVTGMASPGEHQEAKLREEESERKIKEMQDAAREGNMDRMIAAVDAQTPRPATINKPATNQPAPATNAPVKPANITTAAPPKTVQPVPTPRPSPPAAKPSATPPAKTSTKPVITNSTTITQSYNPTNLPRANESTHREASRESLVVNGISKRGGETVLFVNGQVVQVGGMITVNHKGYRYVWRLAAVENDQPRWEKP